MKAAGAVVVVLVRRIAETVARSMPLGSRPLVRVPLVQGHALMRARPRVLLLPLLPGLPMVVLNVRLVVTTVALHVRGHALAVAAEAVVLRLVPADAVACVLRLAASNVQECLIEDRIVNFMSQVKEIEKAWNCNI